MIIRAYLCRLGSTSQYATFLVYITGCVFCMQSSVYATVLEPLYGIFFNGWVGNMLRICRESNY